MTRVVRDLPHDENYSIFTCKSRNTTTFWSRQREKEYKNQNNSTQAPLISHLINQSLDISKKKKKERVHLLYALSLHNKYHLRQRPPTIQPPAFHANETFATLSCVSRRRQRYIRT